MFGWLASWFKKRDAALASIQEDARRLIAHDERKSYYSAQRLAARSRAQGDTPGFLHWTRVAAEIAKKSSVAEMNFSIVKAVADDELDRDR